jgi:hypothetical protein
MLVTTYIYICVYITRLSSESHHFANRIHLCNFFGYRSEQVLFRYTESTRVFYYVDAVCFLLGRGYILNIIQVT